MQDLYQLIPTASILVQTKDGEFDIAPDMVSVDTQKNMGEASGRWQVTLTAVQDAYGRTWAERIRPMDYVQIFLAYVGDDLSKQLTMRGYVDNVNVSTSVTNSSATRSVVINGQDLGKGLNTKSFWVPSSIDPASANDIATAYLIKYFTATQQVSPAEFMNTIFINFYTQGNVQSLSGNTIIPLQNLPQPYSLYFLCTLDAGSSFKLFPSVVFGQLGSIWNIFQYYVSPPFSELFVKEIYNSADNKWTATLLWRFPPFYDRNNNPLGAQFGAQFDYPSAAIDRTASIISADLTQSDNDVISYYAVRPTMGQGNSASGIEIIAFSPMNPYEDTPSIEKYGFRPLDVEVSFLTVLSQSNSSQVAQSGGSVKQIASDLNVWAYNAFEYADIMYSGQIVTTGIGGLGIGDYLYVQSDATLGAHSVSGSGGPGMMRCYIQSIEQKFDTQNALWTTTFSVTRGLLI